jgi:ribosomal-protein-serine acetyltransferase
MKPLRPKAPAAIIQSKRIFLTKHDLTQAKTMFSYVDKDRRRLSQFLPWVDAIQSVKHEAQFIKTTHKWWTELKHFDFSIIRQSDNVYMGNIGVHSIRWDRYSCELGYWILGDFEGQGYMSEAVRAIESEMFKLGFNRVQICCSTANSRSANVPMACHYQHEGTIRQDGVDLGKFRDTLIFGKIQKDWKKQKSRNRSRQKN